MKKTLSAALVAAMAFMASCNTSPTANVAPVDWVNPYIGNISHLLVPTYPTVHLPNSMLRVYPERENFTSNQLNGLPLIVTSHRGSSAFKLSVVQGDTDRKDAVVKYTYDNEIIKPYYYSVDLDEEEINVEFAPSHQSAIYRFNLSQAGAPSLLLQTANGQIKADGQGLSGYQDIGNGTKVYIYLESDIKPTDIQEKQTSQERSSCYVLSYPADTKSINVRYGISYISAEQAQKNLQREIAHFDVQQTAREGRDIWNDALGRLAVKGGTEDQQSIFYTSLYRVYERMVCISEDGQYFSAYDGAVHNDEGTPFYVDDWIWDTYRAAHPLRIILDSQIESHMLNSFIRMAYQQPQHWMPTFPAVNGDSHSMNSNHAVATMLDAYAKGIRSFDVEKAYQASKGAITEKTLAPWSAKPAGVLDDFFKKHGYFPALAVGETETVPEVHSWERRQPVAVTLGTMFDEWCLGNLAQIAGHDDEGKYFLNHSLNYHQIYNAETGFFHPKDSMGRFIEPFDYRYPTGIGARDAYDENNGWEYRWDVQHNIADLVEMMGGKDRFVEELESMFNTPLGKSRWEFYATYPDHSGNVGQFSMGNEPALHIPYLYCYAGQPWRTQKRIRTLLDQWFRNDLMGIPGDEDGGGLTSFVVFSMLGFYPVTPGIPMYVIGSPCFEEASIRLDNGKTFQIKCHNYAPENKYIQSAKLNGKEWNQCWFSHQQLMEGGVLEFQMGSHPNKAWASGSVPPSFTTQVQ